MSIVPFANEFLTFIEQCRVDSYGSPNVEMKDWAEECQAKAKEAGYEPIIQYHEDSYDYCSQINLFTDLLTGDSLVGEQTSALYAFTDSLIKSGRDLELDLNAIAFYTHLCKTSTHKDEITDYLVTQFTTVDLSLECIEDHLFGMVNVPVLLLVMKVTNVDKFNEVFRDVEVIDKKQRNKVYDLPSVSSLTKPLLMSILKYDIEHINDINDIDDDDDEE